MSKKIITDVQLHELGFKFHPIVTPDDESFYYRAASIETSYSHLEVINEHNEGETVKQFLNIEIIEDGYKPVNLELLQQLVPLLKNIGHIIDNSTDVSSIAPETSRENSLETHKLQDIPTDVEIIKGH